MARLLLQLSNFFLVSAIFLLTAHHFQETAAGNGDETNEREKRQYYPPYNPYPDPYGNQQPQPIPQVVHVPAPAPSGSSGFGLFDGILRILTGRSANGDNKASHSGSGAEESGNKQDQQEQQPRPPIPSGDGGGRKKREAEPINEREKRQYYPPYNPYSDPYGNQQPIPQVVYVPESPPESSGGTGLFDGIVRILTGFGRSVPEEEGD